MANTCIPDLSYKNINAEERIGQTGGVCPPSWRGLERKTGKSKKVTNPTKSFTPLRLKGVEKKPVRGYDRYNLLT